MSTWVPHLKTHFEEIAKVNKRWKALAAAQRLFLYVSTVLTLTAGEFLINIIVETGVYINEVFTLGGLQVLVTSKGESAIGSPNPNYQRLFEPFDERGDWRRSLIK